MEKELLTAELLDINDYPHEQHKLVEEFNRKLLGIKNSFHYIGETLSRPQQLRQHEVSGVMRTYSINISNNSVDAEIYEYLDNYENPVLESLGLPCPCPLDSFVYALAEKYVVDSDKERFKDHFNRERLLKAYEEGVLEHVIEYEAGTYIGTRQRVDSKLLLTRNAVTGNIIALCSSKDVTYQKETERKLNEVQQQLDSSMRVIEALTQDYSLVFIVDPKDLSMKLFRDDGANIENNILENVSKDNYQDCLKSYIEKYIPEDEQERIHRIAKWDNIVAEIDKNGISSHKFSVQNEDGTISYHQFTMAKTMAINDEIKYVMAFKNIDDEVKKDIRILNQKEIISAFETEKKTLKLIHSALGSSSCHICFDDSGEIELCEWGAEFRHMLGYENEEDFPNELEAWMDRIYPDDHERVIRSFWKIIDNKESNNSFDVEYRIKTKTGGLRWIHETGGVSRHDDGTPNVFIGLFTDITDKRKSEKAVNEQLEVISALSDEYLIILKINVPERNIRIIKKNSKPLVDKPLELNKKYPYDESIYNYANKNVQPDDVDTLINALSLDVVTKKLADNNSYSSTYRAMVGDELHSIMFTFIKLEDDISLSNVVVGFKIVDDEVQRNKERDKLKKLSETDVMTELTNRASGENNAKEAIHEGRAGMLCILDVDKFKSINDTFGHAVGDEVIIAVAQCLKDSFRDDDIVFRLGGDEFAVLAFDVDSQQLGQKILDRFFMRLEYIGIMELGERKITSSVGAVLIEKNSRFEFEQLYKMADSCVYKSKETEGNKLSFFDKADEDSFIASDLENDLFK